MQALVPTGSVDAGIGFAEVPEPVPEPDEVVVEVEAFSINRGETFLLSRPSPGWRPGKDVAGRIVHTAANGEGPPIGTRVVAHPAWGGWAERVAVAVSKLAPLPPQFETTVAAALPLAGLTALRLLRATGPVASRRVLMTGASGGVGHFFVELAAAQGARVTAITASAERAPRLVELGAAEVVHDIDAAPGPFAVGLDSVGGALTAQVLWRLEPRGVLVWFGQASRTRPTLDFFDWSGASSGIIRKFDYTDSDVGDDDDLSTLVRLVAANRLHPEIGMMSSWERAQEAIDALLDRRVTGKVVLTITQGET